MKPKILIIDDEFQQRGLAEEVKKQYEIEIVHQGEEGIEKVKHGDYDAVLLDCKFKRQLYQGPTIAKKIREFDKSTLVIGFSDMWKIIYDKEMVSYHGHPEVDKHIDAFDGKEQVLEELAKYLKPQFFYLRRRQEELKYINKIYGGKENGRKTQKIN